MSVMHVERIEHVPGERQRTLELQQGVTLRYLGGGRTRAVYLVEVAGADEDERTLFSVGLDGTDEQTHVKGVYFTEARLESGLAEAKAELAKIEKFDAASIEACLREVAKRRAVGLGKVAQPLRVALTGISVSASLFETVALLGKETVLRRLERMAKA